MEHWFESDDNDVRWVMYEGELEKEETAAYGCGVGAGLQENAGKKISELVPVNELRCTVCHVENSA